MVRPSWDGFEGQQAHLKHAVGLVCGGALLCFPGESHESELGLLSVEAFD